IYAPSTTTCIPGSALRFVSARGTRARIRRGVGKPSGAAHRGQFARWDVATAAHERLVLKRRLASLSRWLHIYLSMASFAILLFFAVTGLTLNHAERFGAQPHIAQMKGKVEINWVKAEDAAVDKLAIVEHLRQAHGVKGALSDFRLDESQA